MLHKKKPCGDCWDVVCQGTECPRWQVWFLEAWEGVNRYAWQVMDELGRTEPEKFCYELPHMVRSPCEDCRCAGWCDRPCGARLQWWDARMAQVRKRMRSAE